MIGIYEIKNIQNNKCYVGQAVDIAKRWQTHISALKNNCHRNEYLQNAFNKYGIDTFTFTILEECLEEQLTEREQHYIDLAGFPSRERCYNMKDAGIKGKLCDEAKLKISKALKGKKKSQEHVLKIIAMNTGRKHSDETKAKRSQSLKGRKHSDETKKKIGLSHQGEKSNCAKLTEEQVLEIHNLYVTGNYTKQEIANKFNISRETIGGILTFRSWQYLKENFDSNYFEAIERIEDRRVNQINKQTGEIINTFLSIREASISTGLFESNISKCCKGELNHTGGYSWKKYNLK